MSARVGVVLSGCGVFDGSEIQEAVSILIALDRRKAKIICMAPNIAQSETINHTTKKIDSQSRRVLEEAARIARGHIRDMATVLAEELDALVFPGGYGAVKNLSTFATDGPACKVNEQVERLLREMVKAKKPIGLACIAPVLAARVLGMAGLKPRLTVGTDKETADAINAMKGEHQNAGETDVVIDEANRLVTTPCYMNPVGPWTVYQGAEKMVEEVLRIAATR
ncbi:MAG TPA: isoprenoid biosynthesis glyoxalase ElbB [Tepidisphaeraceae bacterium]|jgi:enhancing lycopene biosynthesis protein 2|nr:isoprenoid biosynthesis glyoxalase ElbB [Tepidisphaeraceae bacterium]